HATSLSRIPSARTAGCTGLSQVPYGRTATRSAPSRPPFVPGRSPMTAPPSFLPSCSLWIHLPAGPANSFQADAAPPSPSRPRPCYTEPNPFRRRSTDMQPTVRPIPAWIRLVALLLLAGLLAGGRAWAVVDSGLILAVLAVWRKLGSVEGIGAWVARFGAAAPLAM